MEPDEYFEVSDVVRILHRSKAVLATWRRQKIGPPYVAYGKMLLYPKADFIAWQRAQVVHTSSPTRGADAAAEVTA